ncbi:ASCH domain-containing protein [Ornithinimicrobium pratense]|uniref:ASCH domain-containing protein n=1 Tax=Ornithinimicrobium pratense TaxID=2593973 RepID=A0A5J6V709_9MICO|nr:ASCH domain-containing protein [Ornithinimicrobium pratense]QFG69820.1 ASCH domain-containing protein [Ornithinimicrobium pratense]
MPAADRTSDTHGTSPSQDEAQAGAIAAFWSDARIRARLNPIEAYTGPGVNDTVPPPAWSFGDDPHQADRLLDLVLTGKKTATASALRDYEDEARELAREQDALHGPAEGDLLVDTDLDLALPEPGLLSILLDGSGRPRALIRITDVQIVRFGDVSAEHARREGEGDGSLAHWRRVHQEFFHRSSTTGEPVDEDTMVVLEQFEVLVPAEARRAARRNGLA